MSETSSFPTTAEALSAERMRRRLDSIANDLAALADTVRRQAPDIDRVGTVGIITYAQLAARVQREVMNALPNLGLDVLTNDAATADIARARGE